MTVVQESVNAILHIMFFSLLSYVLHKYLCYIVLNTNLLYDFFKTDRYFFSAKVSFKEIPILTDTEYGKVMGKYDNEKAIYF